MNEEFRINLYDHNKEGFLKVEEAFNNGEEIVGIVQATGTGKSYVALELVYQNRDKKIIWLVPFNSIKEHILKIIEENNLKEEDLPNLKILTYQSLVDMSKQEMSSLECDMLITDELHHLGAPIWGARINTIKETHPKMLMFGMTAYEVRDRGTIYERDMTLEGTEEIYAGKIVNRYDLVDALIDEVLPKPVYRCGNAILLETEKQLRERLNLDKYEDFKESYLKILDDIKNRANQALNIDTLIKKYVKNGDKIIFFCPFMQEKDVNDIDVIIKEAYNWFSSYINKEDIVFYKTTSKDEKLGKLNRDMFYQDKDINGNDVKNKLRVMFAINQYNEGVHAPGVDGVILARPTKSDIVFYEQLGRALSVKNERKEAPYIIDIAGNFEYIKELEDNLGSRIKKYQKKNKPSYKRVIKLTDALFDLDMECRNIFNMLSYMKERLAVRTWDDWYNLAKAYFEHHGNLKIPQDFKTINGYDYNENGYNLGHWIVTQRVAYKNRNISKEERKNNFKPLSDEQVQKLKKIEMIFDIHLDHWEFMYNLAKAYFEHHGNLKVPQAFKTLNGYEYNENGYNLRVWIGAQRGSYKNRNISKEKRKNRLKPLSDEQVQKLKAIGMIFNVYLDHWEFMYNLAKAYHEHYDNLNIPYNFKTLNGYEDAEEGYSLGQWVIIQRMNCKKQIFAEEMQIDNFKPLTDEQVQKLEAIDMIFVIPKMTWDDWYNLAKTYYEHYGNLKVLADFKTLNGYEYNENGYKLGLWLKNQKTAYKNRSISKEERKGGFKPLTDEQVEKLENIGIIFEIGKNNKEIRMLLNILGIDENKYPFLKRMPIKELKVKIIYLRENNQPLIVGDKLHEIFYMSNVDLEVRYGISVSDLIENYGKENNILCF